MQRIVVTGGSGKLGRAGVQDLIAYGYEVINADIAPPKKNLCPFCKVDFENMAQTIELLSAMDFEHSRGVDAIVHLAAIPGPGIVPNETSFRVNTMSTYNIFEAARSLESETLSGRRVKRCLACPSTSHRPTSHSTKSTRRGHKPAIRFPSLWAKRSQSSSADGIPSLRSSACDSQM